MAETGNIEALAKLVSNDIFKWFKWRICKPCDVNWDCVSEHHNKNTHPSDVVFYYDDPYSAKTSYINTDLKSYAAGSITKTGIERALKSLAMSVECANISESWQDKYLLSDIDFGSVSGLLFVYNHDNDYDKDFDAELNKVNSKEVAVAEDNEVFVFGPSRIQRMCDVVSDLKMLKADEQMVGPDRYTFFYPDLIRARRSGDEWNKPATLESLTSPWLIIKHKATESLSSGFIVYYHQDGDTVEEFVYLLDAMSHYQMFSSDYRLRVRFTRPCTNAITNFERAKHEYLRMWGDDSARQKQMDSIEASQITNFTKTYNPMEIGMRQDD
tara:strand:+ start:6519 stop:7499 length:981 start_codon:yes stop_codon:yes gene_type:complete